MVSIAVPEKHTTDCCHNVSDIIDTGIRDTTEDVTEAAEEEMILDYWLSCHDD